MNQPLPAPSKETIGIIQVFRGLAALAVAMHHAANRIHMLPAPNGDTTPFLLDRFMSTDVGAVGVDLFFIISGFIMVYTTPRESHPQAGSFLRRRIVRIYPLYWVCSVVAMAILATRWVQGLNQSPLDIVKSFLLYPTLYLTSVRPVILPQGWTLIYEMLFYLLFAVTLRWSRPRQTAIVTGVLGVLFVAARLLPGNDAVLVLLRDPVLFEFVLGMILGLLFCHPGFSVPRWLAGGSIALGLLTLAPSAFVPAYDWSIPRLLKFGLPAFLLVAGCLFHPGQRHWRFPRLFPLLGDASYSVYLTHLMVLSLASIAYPRIPALSRVPPELTFVLLVTGIVVLGCACHFWVEKPLLHLCRRRGARPRPTPSAPVAA